MSKLKINSFQFQEILNLKLGCYYPVKKLMTKNEILSVLKFYRFHNKFFPMPIFLDISEKEKKDIENQKKINLYYKKIKIGLLTNFDIFSLEKKKLLKLFFKTKSLSHPGVKNFLSTKPFFISGNIKLSKQILFEKKLYPDYWKKFFRRKKIVEIGSFHTRNIPHKTHEWLIHSILKKCKNILIHPMTGRLKKGDFKPNIVRQAYTIFKKINKNEKIFFNEFKSYARYAGPREASFHALVRKNFGCSHFFVGRDHAGVKNFYKKYESQIFCKKNQKKIGIKILNFKEPGYCKNCKKVTGEGDRCSHSYKLKKFLSGTEIRRMIKLKRKIPEYYVSKEIAQILSKKSLRN